MWRHGDVFIAAVEAIPDGAVRRTGWVLAEGEATGHSHRIERPETVELLRAGRDDVPAGRRRVGHGGPPGASGDHSAPGHLPGLAAARVFARGHPHGARLTRPGVVHARGAIGHEIDSQA